MPGDSRSDSRTEQTENHENKGKSWTELCSQVSSPGLAIQELAVTESKV